jgi:flavorubredoxin
MKEPFRAIKISDAVYWVGAIDWSLRDFHGYLTSRGTTYNAYLILADTITLIDTVKAPFYDEMLSRIASVVEPQKIRFIVSNHAEMDHSGSLPTLLKTINPEHVYASAQGVKALAEHYHMDGKFVAVKEGQSLSLGNKKVTFVETRMLHWPDSMFTYLPDEGILFSQDAFGMHLASSERFADELSAEILEHEAAKYFANILMPFSPLVLKLMERVVDLGLSIRILAPDHGPVWRSHATRIMELYLKWSVRKPTRKAVVIYDTMWESTAGMAQALGDGLLDGGATPKLMPLKSNHRSDVATELLNAGALIVGSPTLNNGIFPTVADALTYIRGLKPQRLVGAAFGSYGWSGEAVDQITEILTGMKVESVGEGLKVRYVPNKEALEKCHALGKRIAERIVSNSNINIGSKGERS